LAQTDKALKQP